MPTTRPGLALSAVLLLALAAADRAGGLTARADDSPAASPKGIRIQESDDELTPLVPARPRTTDDQARVDAAAWYMTGQLREKREDFNGALEAYRKAIAIDPEAVEVYRALVPLAFNLSQGEEAIKYAMKLVELDPQDYELLRRLAVHMAANSKLPEAIQLFEKAAGAATLKKESEAYVVLMHDMAMLYRATGQVEKAADAFEVVFDALEEPKKYNLSANVRRQLRKDENSSYERIGQTFLEAKRPERAIQAFERAAEKGQGLPGTLGYNLAQVYARTEQPEKALEELQKYFDAQLQVKGRAAYELLAEILKALDKSGELIPRVRELAEKDPQNSTLQYFLADQYVEAGQLDEAEAIYKETLARSNDAAGHAGLAAIYRRQHRPAELLQSLAKAVSKADTADVVQAELETIGKDPQMVESLFAVGREARTAEPPTLDYAGSVILGTLAVEAKKTEPAVEFFRHAIKERPDKSGPLYQELGTYLFEADEYKQAADLFRDAAANPAIAGGRPQWLFRLSQAAEMAGLTDEALEAIRDAQKQLPDVALLRYQEGWIHYHSGKLDEAIRVFERVISGFPQDKEMVRRAQFTLSAVYVQKGEERKGREILERIYEEDPDDVSVNNDLGYLYADQGINLEKAESMIRKAVAAEPENAAYLDSLGWVLYKLGRFEEAVPHLEKAVGLESGNDATLWDHLGDAYDRLDKRDKAVEAWRNALKEAESSARPDEKLVERIKEKLNKADGGASKPAADGAK